MQPELLVSGEFPLEGWEEAFRMHVDRRGLKILLKP